MFNPNPQVRIVPTYDNEHLVVIDNFLLEPHKMVELASARRAKFSEAGQNYFPGEELDLTGEMGEAFDQFITRHIRRPLGARRTSILATRLALTTLQPPQLRNLQRICHRDTVPAGLNATGAMVLYLFDNVQLGGTNFFRHKRPYAEFEHMTRVASELPPEAFTALTGAGQGYAVASDDFFDKAYTAEPAWNRAIFYDATQMHSADIHTPELLTNDVHTGRLTVNTFFNLRRGAA